MSKRILLAFATLFACFQVMHAVPAYPGKILVTQPDGTRLEVRRHGDEGGSWLTNAAGQVLRQDADGFYRVASATEADAIRRQASARRAARQDIQARRRAAIGRKAALGQRHFLVILVAFSDLDFQPENTPEAFNDLMNLPGYSGNGATGSARDFYYENSDHRFEPIFDIYGPVTLANKKTYYGGRNANGTDERVGEAIAEACQLLDDEVDFSQYDSDGDGVLDLVFMYYAGYGQADSNDNQAIWPAQWELTEEGINLVLDGVRIDSYACTNERQGYGQLQGKLNGIGTACHEFGHAMGLPDFYDVNDYDNGYAGGLYSFSVMDSGSYNNAGRTPPYFNFEERMMLGWLDETDYLTFDTTGAYTIPPITSNVAYRTYTDMDGEYFVYETRVKAGWDTYLPAHGMLVYHVDKSDNQVYYWATARRLWEEWRASNSINTNGSHPCFYLIPAGNPSSLYYSYQARIPFPYQQVTSYVPKSWSGAEGPITFSQIAFSGDAVTLQANVPTGDIDFVSIADAGSYRAGDRFTFALVQPEEVEAPASVVWYYDDEPAGADSVTLTAGAHTVDARLTYADGRQAVVTLEITVL